MSRKKKHFATRLEAEVARIIAESKRLGIDELLNHEPTSDEWAAFREQVDIELVAQGLRAIEIRAKADGGEPTSLAPVEKDV